MFADKGMGIPIAGEVIEDISDYFGLVAVEHELTRLMFVAAGVNNL